MEHLTARELEVMELLLKGCSNMEIAEALVISIHTSKAFISSIYRKLGVVNRVQAVIKYLEFKNVESSDRI